MRFEIDHLTLYRYSCPVQLGEHDLRFMPIQRPGQQVVACDLQIEPQPSYSEPFIDSWGNATQRVFFQGETERLEIRAALEVVTSDSWANPGPADFRVPVDYGAERDTLMPYLELLEDPLALQAFVEPLLQRAGGHGLAFLHALNRAVHGLYHQGVRLDGPPRRPAETLSMGEGVCRDLALLCMAACRQVGIAARFVSGYQQGDAGRQIRYLHAWPEAYLPHQGWLGFDPTHDTFVSEAHVAVAAAPIAAAVSPVQGGYRFRGAELTSWLDTEVVITARQP